MNKKKEILKASIELFALQGYEKTSINTICEKAKVSKGLVFHYFKNKEKILREVFKFMEEVMSEVSENVESNRVANEALSPKEKLVSLVEHIFISMTLPENALYYQFDFQVLAQPRLRNSLQDLFDKRYQIMMESFQSILEEIPSASTIVDSHMLIAEIDGITLNYLIAKDKYPPYPLDEIKTRFINKYLLLLGV